MHAKSLVVSAVCLVALNAAAQTTYRFKVTPGAGGARLVFWDINAAGHIVAETTPASGNPGCALRNKNTSTAIADPRAAVTQCYGISNADAVVGYYLPSSNQTTAVGFTYKGGAFTDFLAAGSNAAQGGTQLNAISAAGTIVAGTYSDASGLSLIFTLKGGKQTDIKVAGQNYLVATGVNDKGAVAAQSFDASGNLLASYLIAGGKAVKIAYPGKTTLTSVHTIDDAGLLVGAYTDVVGNRHGFTYDSVAHSYSKPIYVLKSASTTVLGINSFGAICGSTTPSGGVKEGYVGVPAK